MMRQVDRYLGKTLLLSMLTALVGLVGILVIFTFLDQIEDMKNDYTIWTGVQYVAWSLPRIIYDALPFAILIGSLTGLGSLASRAELIVMRAAGISTWRILGAAMQPALALIIAGLLVGELLLPDFERIARLLKEDATELNITPQGGFWYREGNRFMHFRVVNPDGTLRDITQYTIDTPAGTDSDTSAKTDTRTVTKTARDITPGQGLSMTFRAKRGHYSPPDSDTPGHWVLHEVTLTQLDSSSMRTRSLSRLSWNTNLTPDILSTDILVKPEKMSMLELRTKIKHLQKQGLSGRKFVLGLWGKLLQPLASLSLVLVAVSFIFGPLRETSMGLRVLSGIIIGIMFKFLQDLLSPASLVFGFSPLIATLTPICICLGVGYLLLKRAN